jgi:hypothetical protein
VHRPQRLAWLAPLLLLVVTLAAWGRVPWGDFHYDDHRNLVEDGATAGGAALRERLTTGIRPLLRLSYHLDHRLWGLEPAGFLATNLTLHLLTVAGVWLLARRRLGDATAACAAALVFAIQPANAEVVAYVSGRSTGLMTALVVWGFCCHEQARRTTQPARGWRAASVACFVAACLVKEVAVVFPALLAVWEWTRDGRLPRRLLAVAAAAAIVLVAVGALSPRYRALAQFSFALRDPLDSLATNLRAVPVMLSLWVRPWALSIEHELPAASAGTAALGVATLSAIGVALASRRRAPLVALATGWTLVALLPTNSLVAKLDPITEKPLYLAWIGPALLAGAGAAWLRRAAGTRALALAGVLVVTTGVAFSAQRVAVWSDARRLWADATEKAPGKARPWVNLGVAWLHDDPAASARALREALRRDPGNTSARRTLLTLEVLCGPSCERSAR